MNNQLVIRSYLKHDRTSCLEMFDRNCPNYFDVAERADFETWLNGQDQGRIVYDESMADFFYIVLNNLQAVGCGGFYVVSHQPIARISWTLLDPAFHGKGIGTYLITYCINKIEQLFPTYAIELGTSQHTAPFFEKLGFTTTSIVENGYGKELHRYNMVRGNNDITSR